MSMHDVRLLFKKQGRAKYISHLDMNRLLPRVLKRSKLPVWFTEGFNPHAYLTFALPLSLGYTSEYDIVDFRITDDDMSNEAVMQALKSALPDSIVPIEVINPVMKTKEIRFAQFFVDVECDEDNYNLLMREINAESIIVTKKTKKGGEKQFDVTQFINKRDIVKTDFGARVELILTAGNEDNINPQIIFDAVLQKGIVFDIKSVVRGNIFDKNMTLFR